MPALPALGDAREPQRRAERAAAGIDENGLVRLSVGLEGPDEIERRPGPGSVAAAAVSNAVIEIGPIKKRV